MVGRTVSVSGPKPPRPTAPRRVSGSAETGHFPGFTAVDSPVQTPTELTNDGNSVPNPDAASAKSSQLQQPRSLTASPAVFGMAKLDQSGWSDSSAPNTGSPSSVWNGRGGSHAVDSDAAGTAATSTVSTPGRTTKMEPTDMTAAPASTFTPSPLLPQDGSAWSNNVRSSTVKWPQELASATNEPKHGSSPTESKRAALVATSKAVPSTDVDADRVQRGTAAEGATSVKRTTATPAPKRAPIRSTTLDPSQLPGGNSRLTDDTELASPSTDELAAELEGASLDAPATAATSGDNLASMASPPSSAGLIPTGYQSPPLTGHFHRPSGSYGPFSPGDAFVQPTPYLPGSGARSPDGFAHPYHGMPPAMHGMPPIDMSGYESYRTTPDPYAPTMPGRPIFASPGSQGSTPQSPSFGPTVLPPFPPPSMRNGEALFYPGPAGGPGFVAPPPHMGAGAGPMGHSVRPPMMGPGNPHYGYAPMTGPDGRSPPMGQSPMMAPGMPIPMTNMGLPPTSPIMQAQMSPPPPGGIPGGPMGPDRRMSQSHGHGHQYVPGIHRRMGSHAESQHGPMMPMSPRPPFPLGAQPGPGGFMPGQPPMPGFSAGAPMPGPSMAWNGRFPDHRRVPTGPGGVMAPPMGFGSPMDPNMAARHGHGPGMYAGFGSGNGAGPHGSSAAGSAGSSTSRSALLEEFRARHAKNRKFELKDIFGHVVEFSGDQHGSRFIQEKLDTASADDKKKVFDEILPNARQLMTDVFGNYVIQKLFEHGNDEQRAILAFEMEGHILSLSLGTYGCRVVQKGFDHVSEQQRIKLSKELDGHTLQCVRDQNANHVVQKILERVAPSEIDFIPKAFQGQVPSLASHCYSCRVLQRIFEHCDESQSRSLLQELHAEAFRLMQDQYGNYVIQWVLQRGQPRDRAAVIAKIKGSILQLSRHKFASNVIEEVIRNSDPKDRSELIDEILTPRVVPLEALAPGDSAMVGGENASATTATPGQQPTSHKVAPAVLMMKDQFANYVLQRCLEMANKEQRAKLVGLIRSNLNAAKKHPQGHSTKHLVAIERLIETLPAEAKQQQQQQQQQGAASTGVTGVAEQSDIVAPATPSTNTPAATTPNSNQ